jgi:hypothetical protein
MSYAVPQWISPFHYCALLTTISSGQLICPAGAHRLEQPHVAMALQSGMVRVARPMGLRSSPGQNEHRFLYVSGRVFADGRAEFDPFEVVTTTDDIATKLTGGDYQLLLQDGAARPLADLRFDASRSPDRHAHSAMPFSMFVPYERPASRIILLQQGNIIAERRPSSGFPQVALRPIAAGEAVTGKQIVAWEANDASPASLVFSLWYSPDHGQTWLPLNVCLRGTSVEVDFDFVPASDQALLRILASNGINTTEVRTQNTFIVPAPAR